MGGILHSKFCTNRLRYAGQDFLTVLVATGCFVRCKVSLCVCKTHMQCIITHMQLSGLGGYLLLFTEK